GSGARTALTAGTGEAPARGPGARTALTARTGEASARWPGARTALAETPGRATLESSPIGARTRALRARTWCAASLPPPEIAGARPGRPAAAPTPTRWGTAVGEIT